MSKRGEEKRALLLESALTVIERIGVRKTTLEDVAAEARVSRSTMYYHFESKADLFSAVIDNLIAHIQQMQTEGIDANAPADVRLVQSYAALAGEVQRLLTLYAVTRDVAGEMVPQAQRQIDRFQEWHLSLVADLLRDGVESGCFVVADPEGLSRTIQKAFQGLFNPVVNEDWDHLVEDSSRLLRVILRGIAAQPAEEAPC